MWRRSLPAFLHSIPLSVCFLLWIHPFSAFAQYGEENEPVTEWSAGLKTAWGEFVYGPRYFETTRFSLPGFQPTVRVDWPIRMFTIRDNPVYINITASGGLLYIPNRAGTVQYLDPVSGQTSSIARKSPFYLPFYLGVYNPGAFGLGVEAFYAKGLNGVADMWGLKLLGLSYNHRLFRINAAWEMAVPVKFNPDNPSSFFSFDFLWKLRRREE